MPQLLLEIFSEEIPARMQATAARDLERLVVGGLTDRGFLNEGARSFATPRRLALVIEGLPAQQSDVREERKGPKVDAPDAAIQGFLRSTGLTKDQLKVQKDPKGDFYLAVTERKGRPTPAVIAELIPEVVKSFPWPKSQRWGAGDLTWVRPLHSILCTFDGEVVPFEVGTVRSGNRSRGHRFLGNNEFEARRFDDYVDKLKRAHVILAAADRKAQILHDAKQLAHAQNLELIEDDGLADEVAGLVEWPVPLIGQFDKGFLDVPQEILISTMRANQKYFALKDPKTGKLANKFVVIANMITKDGGKNVVAGNERVLRARLSDAKFFWDQDRKTKLEARVPALKDIVFHAKLGTQLERVQRIELLAGEIACLLGADTNKAKRAGHLCKADLTSGTVGEFPEVQGTMGAYFARGDGEDGTVAEAIRDHYKPQGPADSVPESPIGIAVALADKIDTLVGFWSIGEKPTGSRDPFGLRRAALGIIRIILERRIRLDLEHVVLQSSLLHDWLPLLAGTDSQLRLPDRFVQISKRRDKSLKKTKAGREESKAADEMAGQPFADDKVLLDFFYFLIDRIYVQFRAAGFRHDVLTAVAEAGLDEDLILFVDRVEAVQQFLKSDDGKSLVAGYKRAANILRIEEAKEKKRNPDHPGFGGELDRTLLSMREEQELDFALTRVHDTVVFELKRERYQDAMKAMTTLRAPVDAFFDKVTVNADNPKLRENRLKLLSEIRDAMHTVADFSKIEG